MKKKAKNFLGFVFAVIGAVLVIGGCDNGTTDEVRTPIAGLPDGKTGEAIKRVVPETLTIIKATEDTVLVGVEIPAENDPDEGIAPYSNSGFGSGLVTYTTGGRTYYAGTVSAPGEVSITFVSEHNRIVGVEDGIDDVVTDTKKVFKTVAESDFRSSYTIPAVTAADYTVYSGKSGDANGTYLSSLGVNGRRIVVTLPGDGQVSYLKYRYKFAAGPDLRYRDNNSESSEYGTYITPSFASLFSGKFKDGTATLDITPVTRYTVDLAPAIKAAYPSLTHAVVGRYNAYSMRSSAITGTSVTVGGYSDTGSTSGSFSAYYTYVGGSITASNRVPVYYVDGTPVQLDGTAVASSTTVYSGGSFYGPYVPIVLSYGGSSVLARVPLEFDTVQDLPTTVELKFDTVGSGYEETASATAATVTLTGYAEPTSGFSVVR